MTMASGLLLTTGLILGGAGHAVGQMFPSPGGGGMVSGQTPEMAEMQKAQEQMIKAVSPELHAFQERLRKIEVDIEKILESFSKDEIDKDEAKAELLPLVKEEQAIQSDPDFLVEQRLMQVYFSSPEYKAKVQKMMLKFNVRRQPAR